MRKGVKELDITQRHVHCTDRKRKTTYVKDNNKWEKENDDKPKLKKIISEVFNKNLKLLPEFKKKYPGYNDSTSKQSDKYSKIMIELMGGNNNDEIINNISNVITIEK